MNIIKELLMIRIKRMIKNQIKYKNNIIMIQSNFNSQI